MFSPALHQTITRTTSRAMYLVCAASMVIILALLALVTGYLAVKGFTSISWDFFTRTPTGNPDDAGGMANGLVGTIVLISLASLAAIPMGILSAIYLSEYGANSYIAAPVRFVSDVLAGVPSIVVGILGYELLVVPLGKYNAWAGAGALAFIMVPIITRTTEEMLRLVPNSYREASVGLGATKAATILRVVLPAATGSLVTGIMLSVARIAGETAPLLFTALGSRLIPIYVNGQAPYAHAELDSPFPSLTVQIFQYATGPYEAQRDLAWAGMLVLIALIFVMNLAIRFFTRSRRVGRA